MKATQLAPISQSAWPVQVFAVDDCSAQLVWRASPAQDLRLEIGDCVLRPVASPKAELVLSLIGPKGLGHPQRRRLLDPRWPGGPGSVMVEGLEPGTDYDVLASANGIGRQLVARFRALEAPEGKLLYKFATVSDLHIGEQQFGVLGRIHDPNRIGLGANNDGQGRATGGGAGTGEPFPVRALRAALSEIVDWGAQLLVVKGDLTRLTTAAEVRDVAELLSSCGIPVEVMLGNHDNKWGVDVRAILARVRLVLPWRPWARDIPGLRLVFVNTQSGDPRYHRGEVPPPMARETTALAAEGAAEGLATWVGLHHPPELRAHPLLYPPGIPWAQSRVLLASLAKAQPATFVTCGHRHRNTRYSYGPIVISEVGSTKDYPGGWAGYKVFEGGIMQAVRRTACPQVMAWTEATRRALNGQWAHWSTGRLEQRSFSVDWARGVGLTAQR